MNKKIIALILVVVFVFSVAINTKAATIEELTVLVEQLQAQLATLRGNIVTTTICNFDTDLKQGMTNYGVELLQKKLGIIKTGYYGTQTGYFGTQTLAAVKAYQISAGIPSTGYVGSLTRAQLNAQYCTFVVPNNWKTYRDENLGFEIKYPEGTITFCTKYPEGVEVLCASTPEISSSSKIKINMRLPFTSNNVMLNDKTLDIDAVESWPCEDYENPNFITVRDDLFEIEINGVYFNKTDLSGSYQGMESGARATEYCTMRGDKPFRIITQLGFNRYIGEPFNEDKESEILIQVLSTLKFLK